ncbi:MAG: VOC family protein [Burkholderiales bacterium]
MKRKAKRKPARKASPRKVQPMPKSYNAITPYLAIRGAAQAIDFYKQAFGAKEVMRMPGPGGKLGHAELKFGDAKIMLADEHEPMNFLGPQARGGSPVHMHLYVNDVDATVAKAVQLGAKVVREVQDMFYGDRSGTLEDPFGHFWHVATHKRDVSMAEMKRKAAEMAQQAGS